MSIMTYGWRFHASLFALLTVAWTAPAAAAPVFTLNMATTVGGLSYANSVSDFTTAHQTDGAGSATAILGAPDSFGSVNPNVAGIVDFGGGNAAEPWAVTLGFGSAFADGAGYDLRIFTTQLDPTEGWLLYASADGAAMSLLGTFVPPEARVGAYFSIDVDFNGTPLPEGARFLRFVGTQTPITASTRGADFDAVGVRYSHSANAVPEPGTLALLALGLAACTRRRLGNLSSPSAD